MSFTVPKIAAVEVCAKLRQIPNAINATIAATNLPNTYTLTPGLITIFPSSVLVRFSIAWTYKVAGGCLYIQYRGYFWRKWGVKMTSFMPKEAMKCVEFLNLSS